MRKNQWPYTFKRCWICKRPARLCLTTAITSAIKLRKWVSTMRLPFPVLCPPLLGRCSAKGRAPSGGLPYLVIRRTFMLSTSVYAESSLKTPV